MSEQRAEPRSGYATYCDYEEADCERPSEMEGIVRKHGGVVRGTIASEEECEALVSFAGIPEENAESFRSDAEDAGWEIEWG